MNTEYTIRVRTPKGVLIEVRIQATTYGAAAAQAEAYGTVIGLLESRYV